MHVHETSIKEHAVVFIPTRLSVAVRLQQTQTQPGKEGKNKKQVE